jgi:hypothetical protein
MQDHSGHRDDHVAQHESKRDKRNGNCPGLAAAAVVTGIVVASWIGETGVAGTTLNNTVRSSLMTRNATFDGDLGLTTDFWRSQFGTMPDKRHFEEHPTTTINAQIAQSLVMSYSSEGGVTAPIDVPTGKESTLESGSTEHSMSEWETAESKASGPARVTLTQNGPSLVSGVVAVVALIVVFGAYLRGR